MDNGATDRCSASGQVAKCREAETVRRTWLTEYASLKGATKEATAFLATAVLHGDRAIVKAFEQRHRYARQILKMDTAHGEADRLAEAMNTGSENRVTQLAVVAVLAGYEDATGVHSWRNPDESTGRYLTFLAACGYTLSTVERLAIPKPKPAKARASRARKTVAKAPSSPAQPTEATTTDDSSPQTAEADLSPAETATDAEDTRADQD